ncbi:putative Apolipoprotein D [Hypsibius exemplaris]|uniref:Apolipoprotein D n=1 Tax=Hypsibius exemplaris TaxID=2072580 RepID=A0A1W0X8Y8_HYPEX|nr:putative Apolipoprotein D [Hypsibius exemplaris]
MAGKSILVFAVLVLAAVSVRASFTPGRCPVVPVKADFDVAQYLGVWYDIRSYFTIFQAGVNCSRADYTSLNATHVRVNNTGTKHNKKGEKIAINATGVAYAPNASIPAKLKVKFDNQPNVGDYWVVDTDYSNYAIVWSCKNIASGLFHISYSWVLGRNSNGFSPAVEGTIDQLLAKNNIDATLYEEVVQTGCVNY